MVNSRIIDIALRIAARPVLHQDIPRLFRDVSSDLAAALDVAAVVLLVPRAGWVGGSDDTATLVGSLQLQASTGPLLAAIVNGSPTITPDLSREVPSELAALAAGVGLRSSAAAPLLVDSRPVGAVQVLGAVGQSVTSWHLDVIAPVRSVLAARLVDGLELRRLGVLGRAPADAVPSPRTSDVPPPRHRKVTI